MTRIFSRILILSVCVLALAATSFAATAKEVSYKSGDETVKGVLYTPAGSGPFPGVVVIHEWWGLNDWVKEQASKLADQGYVALAIDLYRGKVADNPDLAHELMRGTPDDRAKRDLNAAFEFLSEECEAGSHCCNWLVHGRRACSRCCLAATDTGGRRH